MECTQRLECTQSLSDNIADRTCLEQVGFLGICGLKHPIQKGPNKIGRDPQTCSIVLNDNSISRQHAVINILNKTNFMLMDLDSANKTKLLNKTLQPYIPHPLQNGDTIQFGQLFGIFRLLEENDNLPMTQAVEIPDTPVSTHYVSRLKTIPITTIPESPDVSDRDDSIIVQSQSQKKKQITNSNNNFIKSSGKLIGIQQVGTNKIDNVYWNSSKKSESFGANFENNCTISKNSISPKKLCLESSIYEMETQPPQHVKINQTSDSLHGANTQVSNICPPPTIYSCETQPPNENKLPHVFKVQDQSNVQINLYSSKDNQNIFDAETHITLKEKNKRVTPIFSYVQNSKLNDICSTSKALNSSDEEICFDENDCQQLEDESGSQTLLPLDSCNPANLLIPIINSENQKENMNIISGAIVNDSDSKDCEEIAPSQLVPEKVSNDGDMSNCEDNMIKLMVNGVDPSNNLKSDDDVTDYEDDLIIVNLNNKQNTANDSDITDCEDDFIEISQNRLEVHKLNQKFEDIPTQVIEEEISGNYKEKTISDKDDVLFEDMLTQVIEEFPIENNINNVNALCVKDCEKSVSFEDREIQVIDILNPQEHSNSTLKNVGHNNNFKLPLSSPHLKKKDSVLTSNSKVSVPVIKEINLQQTTENIENYYDATQQIINDLCTQNEQLVDPSGSNKDRNVVIAKRSLEDSDSIERIHNYDSNISKEGVKVIGVDLNVVQLQKKKSSTSSDLEVTPKKFNISKFLMIDLPSSQDIKSCDFVSSKMYNDSSDDFEETEEQVNNKDVSPAGFHRKQRKQAIKLDLMKKFNIDTLPTRAITRIRKPTSKIINSDEKTKKNTARILESKLGLDKDTEIDAEVLQLNLQRLRRKMEKVKNKTSTTESIKSEENTASEQVKKKEILKKHDKKESKELRLHLGTEQELKQQSIKSMLKDQTSSDTKILEPCNNVKTKSTDSTHNNRRSSRNRNKGNQVEQTVNKVQEVISDSTEKKELNSRTRSNLKQIKEIVDLTGEVETVVRRSRRQLATKEKSGVKKEGHKEKNKLDRSEKNNSVISKTVKNDASSRTEISAVYNLSTEMAVDDISLNLKRQATSEIFASKSKKLKSSNIGSASVRATSSRGNMTQYVLFTAFPCEEVKVKLEKLGAVIVSEVKTCTVVLTLQIRRTFKLLCALGLGKPIVGPNWVQACADCKMIVDPWLYLMKDEVTEKRFGFNLRQALTCKRNFLKGYNVFCTPNVTPNAQEMKSIVECSGGTWKEGGKSWFCVSSSADKNLWPELRKRGAILVSTEFILGGVVQQKINLNRDRLV